MTVQMIQSLIGVVVGAALTLIVQAVVQLRVVPQVESRKRREDRWEKHVLELAELLVSDLPPALLEFNLSIVLRELIKERPDVDMAKRREAEERLAKAYTTLSRIQETKVHWLMKRILSLAPDSPDLRRFEQVCFMLHASASSRNVGVVTVSA